VKKNGDMAELVDAPDSKSGAFGRSGSTPDIPTKSDDE
tara:strand:+ start:1869 stop:1982 length:114 start_codon:yes stop_codon:yes gene_type:complete